MTSNHLSTCPSSVDYTTEPVPAKILTGVPIARQANMMDLGSLCTSELHSLKKNDPFMYYSIPGATNPRLSEQDIDIMLPSLVMGSSTPNLMNGTEYAQPRHSPRSRHRSVSDSQLFVERRSRITFESHFDVVMEGIIGEMEKLQAQNTNCKMRRSSSCTNVQGKHVDQLQVVQ